EILVEDYTFPIMNIYDVNSQFKVLSVKNNGDEDLNITGISSITNPVFSSPDISATSVSWGRFRAKNPTNGTTPQNDPLWVLNPSSHMIEISNTGTDSVTYKFSKIEVVAGDANSFYIREKTSGIITSLTDFFTNGPGSKENILTVQTPKNSYEVFFRPESIGTQQIQIHFKIYIINQNNNSDSLELVVELSGTGTIPKIRVDNQVNFGNTILGDITSKKTRIMTITNDNSD